MSVMQQNLGRLPIRRFRAPVPLAALSVSNLACMCFSSHIPICRKKKNPTTEHSSNEPPGIKLWDTINHKVRIIKRFAEQVGCHLVLLLAL